MQENKVKVLDISEYNVRGKLGGVGRSILIHVVHDMNNVPDIQHFVCSCRSIHDVTLDKHFPWSIAQALSHSYPLHLVPIELVDIVCIFPDLLL